MRIVDFGPDHAVPVEAFSSRAVASHHLGSGRGVAHVYTLHFEAGGSIGRHEAGFDQLFLVVAGRGWVEGGDGKRVELAAGQAARFARGELHAKGSDSGMTAVMVQVETLEETGPAT